MDFDKIIDFDEIKDYEIESGILTSSFMVCGDLVVPDGVKEIAATAFFNERAIRSVVLPPTLERIRPGAFMGCDHLVRVVIPQNAKIGVNAFLSCFSCITSLPIRQWKERYGISKLDYALNYIYNYKSGDPFFDSVKEENNIFIKNNLIALINRVSGDGIFFVNYVTREIPLDIDRVEALLDKFSGNVETASVLLDYKKTNFSEEFLEKRAAEQTEKELGLRKRTIADWKKIFTLGDDKHGGYIIKKYKGRDIDVIIPETIGKRTVTEIGKRAFSPFNSYGAPPLGNIQNIRAVYIPESVTKIGELAFSDCDKLETVNLPSGLTCIADETFISCSSLSEIEIPSSVTSIGKHAFAYCKSLTSVTIPDGVKDIGHSAFLDCNGLAEITLPGSLMKMGYSVFADCQNLAKAVISKGSTIIMGGMFSRCRKLAEVQLPDGILKLETGAFYDCRSLKRIILPSTVRDISNAFQECGGLEELVIPAGVKEIAPGAFHMTIRLKKITLPDTITQIGAGAFELSGITSVKIPSGVTVIERNTFRGCGYLDDVKIPASVTKISPDAFYLASANMVISAPRGSYAIEFAKKDGIKFKELPI